MSRRTVLAALLVAVPLLLAAPVAGQTCVPGVPRPVPCLPVGEPTPAPSVEPSPEPSAQPSPSEGPESQDFSTGTSSPDPAATGQTGEAVAPTLGGEFDAGTVPVAEPVAEPLMAPQVAGFDAARPPAATVVPVVARGSVAQSLSGLFALVVGALLALPLLLSVLAGRLARSQQSLLVAAAPHRLASDEAAARRLRTAGLPADAASAVAAAISQTVAATVAAVAPSRPDPRSSARPRTPGDPMNPSGNRLYLGLGALAVAALAGFVGWYQLAGNPYVNEQLPYLASAGVIVVIASAVGGALLVADQLRGDDRRIEELEDAVRGLTEALSPMIEAPARGPVRELRATRVADDDHEDSDAEEEPPARVVRRPRASTRRASQSS